MTASDQPLHSCSMPYHDHCSADFHLDNLSTNVLFGYICSKLFLPGNHGQRDQACDSCSTLKGKVTIAIYNLNGMSRSLVSRSHTVIYTSDARAILVLRKVETKSVIL